MLLLHAALPIKMLKILPAWRSSPAARFTINSSQFSTLRRPNSINQPLLLSGSFKRTLLWNQNNHRHFSISTSITNLWITISNSTPVAYFQHGLVNFHDITGLPWWTTIILSTILLRSCITVPLTIYQNKIVARIELISMEMPDIVKQLKVEASQAKHMYGWTDKQTRNVFNRSVKKQLTALIVRENCHPMKTMIVLWGQIPLWIIQSVAMIGMLPNPNVLEAQLAFTQLTMGGFGWIPNLTEIDSSYILPVTLGILNLAIIEIQVMSKIRPPSKLQKYTTNFFRILSVCMVPIAATVPSALALYWTTSSAFGLTQNLVLMSPKIRELAGVPKTPNQLDDPYRHLADVTRESQFISDNIQKRKCPQCDHNVRKCDTCRYRCSADDDVDNRIHGNTSSNSSLNNTSISAQQQLKPVPNHGKPNCAPKPPGIQQIIASKNGNNGSSNGSNGTGRPTVARHHSMKTPRSPPVAPGVPVFPSAQHFGTMRGAPQQFQSQDAINRPSPTAPIGRPTVAPPRPPTIKPPPPPTPIRSISNTNLTNLPLSLPPNAVNSNSNFGSASNVSTVSNVSTLKKQMKHQTGSGSANDVSSMHNTTNSNSISNNNIGTQNEKVAPPLPPHRTCPAPPPPVRQNSNSLSATPPAPVPPQRHSSIRNSSGSHTTVTMQSAATITTTTTTKQVNRLIIDLEKKFSQNFHNVTEFRAPGPFTNLPKSS